MVTETQSLMWLKKIIQIRSVLGNEKEVVDYLKGILESEGITTYEEVVLDAENNRSQLVVTLKGEKECDKVLGFTGHLDVVPVGDEAWEYDPFSGYETDGKIYGRGSTDMKSGVMAILVSLINLKQSGKPFSGTLKLLLTAGEESSGIGAAQLVEQGYANDLTALLTAEPSLNYTFTAEKGALWLEFKTTGKTAHGSTPEEGINAVDHMLAFIQRFKERIDFSQYTDKLLGTATCSLNVLQGGKATNVVPDSCIAQFDIRTVPSLQHSYILQTIRDIQNELESEIKDFDFNYTVLTDLSVVNTPYDDPFVELVLNARTDIAAPQPGPLGYTGYTDAAQFIKVNSSLPIVILGPGGTLAHQTNEYVTVSDYLNAIQIYDRIINDYLEVTDH
ncbi:MAG: ArgE/DapE family deacylase [Bacteroides sp.]|nr:ArgE/DapE family deacylase [Bacteroides sp.]